MDPLTGNLRIIFLPDCLKKHTKDKINKKLKPKHCSK